jgi:hypothetical protein
MTETLDEFLAEHTNGWVLVILARERGPKQHLFANVVGPWPTKREAGNAAARARREFRHPDNTRSTLVKASVRPLWKPEVK